MEKRNFSKMISKPISENIFVSLCERLSEPYGLNILPQNNTQELHKGSIRPKSFNHSIIQSFLQLTNQQ
jgi:hypothetical protein